MNPVTQPWTRCTCGTDPAGGLVLALAHEVENDVGVHGQHGVSFGEGLVEAGSPRFTVSAAVRLPYRCHANSWWGTGDSIGVNIPTVIGQPGELEQLRRPPVDVGTLTWSELEWFDFGETHAQHQALRVPAPWSG